MTGSCCDAPCHEAQADSLTVCTNCGTVVSAELLVVGSDATTDADKGFSVTLGESRARTERMRSGTAPGSFKGIAQMGLGRTMSELRKSNQTQLLLSAIHALRVPLTVQHPTMRLFETAVAKNVSLNGRRGVAGLAVCLMLALRQMSVPKPLPDILQFFGCDPALFGRIYRAIRTVVAVRAPPLDPSTYIARLCHITMTDKTDPSKLARLESLSHAAMRFAKHAWTDVGRRPSGIAVAAVSMGLEALLATRISPRAREELAEAAKTTLATAQCRHGELKRLIMEYARQLPFFKDVTERNFYKLLLDILGRADMILARASRNVIPPESVLSEPKPVFASSKIEAAGSDDEETLDLGDLDQEVQQQASAGSGNVPPDDAAIGSDTDDDESSISTPRAASVPALPITVLRSTSSLRFKEAVKRLVERDEREAGGQTIKRSKAGNATQTQTSMANSGSVGLRADQLATARLGVPPSFAASVANNQDLSERISRSRRRVRLLQDPLNVDGGLANARDDAAMDDKDMLIDVLVLRGMDDNTILNSRFKRGRHGGWSAAGFAYPTGADD